MSQSGLLLYKCATLTQKQLFTSLQAITRAGTLKVQLREPSEVKVLVSFFSHSFKKMISDDVYIFDQGGKDPGLGRSECDHCFQTKYFFFPFLGGG